MARRSKYSPEFRDTAVKLALTGTFTATGSMALIRQQHSAVIYATGKVLVSGGGFYSGGLKDCELYDIST